MKKEYLVPQIKNMAFNTRYGVLDNTLSDPNHSNSGDEVIHWGGDTGGEGPDPEAKRGVWDDF